MGDLNGSAHSGTAYPCYAAWKALKANNGPEIERWIMHFSVLTLLTFAESTVEWTIDWLPFYSQAKALALLWLTLPSIRGTSYVYVTLLGPLLEEHEKDIDAAYQQAKSRAREAGLEYLRQAYAALREAIYSAAGINTIAVGQQPLPAAQPTQSPPTLNDPIAGPAAQAWTFAGSLIRQYGPAAIAAGSAVLHPMQGREITVSSATESSVRPPNKLQKRRPTEIRERRAELERELSELKTPEPSPAPPSRLVSPHPIEHSFVGGQRFEEISPDEAPSSDEVQRRLSSGWWFRSPSGKSKVA